MRVVQRGEGLFTAALLFFDAYNPELVKQRQMLFRVGATWIPNEQLAPYAGGFYLRVNAQVLSAGAAEIVNK